VAKKRKRKKEVKKKKKGFNFEKLYAKLSVVLIGITISYIGYVFSGSKSYLIGGTLLLLIFLPIQEDLLITVGFLIAMFFSYLLIKNPNFIF